MAKILFEKKPNDMKDLEWRKLEVQAVSTIWLCLVDEVVYHILDEVSPTAVWSKLEERYMSKLLTNQLYLKQKLYRMKMTEGSDLT